MACRALNEGQSNCPARADPGEVGSIRKCTREYPIHTDTRGEQKQTVKLSRKKLKLVFSFPCRIPPWIEKSSASDSKPAERLDIHRQPSFSFGQEFGGVLELISAAVVIPPGSPSSSNRAQKSMPGERGL
jgi:hypothetical protein